MFSTVRKAAALQVVDPGKLRPKPVLADDAIKGIPEKFTLTDLRSEVTNLSKESLIRTLEDLLVVETCLRDQDHVIRMTDDEQAVDWLYIWTSNAIRPPAEIMPHSEYEVETNADLQSQLLLFWNISWLGIEIIKRLDGYESLNVANANASVFLSLAVFTDKQDAWTTEAIFESAISLLQKHQATASSPFVLVNHILRDTIKPLFAKSKPPSITPQGRRAIAPVRQPYEAITSEASNKPWKFEVAYILTPLRWVFSHLNSTLVEASWPLLIPPLLTLLDDESPAFKARGCALVPLLVAHTPAALLERTGIGALLHDALMPCLLHLPTLTPLPDSLALLAAAYPALLALAHARHPHDAPARNALLSQILRDGVLRAHAHCGDTVEIATLLVRQLSALVAAMSIASAKHLKDVLPLLADVLADPFGSAHPPLLRAAAETLQTVILTDWPRVGFWRGEILRGVLVCWARMDEEGGEEGKKAELDRVKTALEDAVGLLKAALQDDGDVDVQGEWAVLVKADERLKHVLGKA